MEKKVEVKILSPLINTEIPLPSYATDGSAGIDLRACIDEAITVKPNQTILIPSGIAINIHDPGLMAVIAPRSGLGIKHGIVLGNLIGVVDSDYLGQIQIGIWNRNTEPFIINPGDRICQMMFVPVIQVNLEIVDNFSCETQRGTGGFGHTGKN